MRKEVRMWEEKRISKEKERGKLEARKDEERESFFFCHLNCEGDKKENHLTFYFNKLSAPALSTWFHLSVINKTCGTKIKMILLMWEPENSWLFTVLEHHLVFTQSNAVCLCLVFGTNKPVNKTSGKMAAKLRLMIIKVANWSILPSWNHSRITGGCHVFSNLPTQWNEQRDSEGRHGQTAASWPGELWELSELHQRIVRWISHHLDQTVTQSYYLSLCCHFYLTRETPQPRSPPL